MAGTKYKRVRNRGDQIDPFSIDSNSYSEGSGARKIVPAGWIAYKILGALNTAISLPQGTNVAVYNNSATTAFVGFYPSGTPIVPGATNAVAIPPNSYIYLNSGINNFIIGSASTVLGYQMEDETVFGPTNPNM